MRINKKYFLLGSLFGLGLLIGLIFYLPDGKLHLVFCDVGQGDGIYIKTPNRADIVIDGGANDRILSCLGQYMPFYDREIDVVVLTHPQKDHIHGLVAVLQRFRVKHFVTVPVTHTIEEYEQVKRLLSQKQVSIHYLTHNEIFAADQVHFTALWPSIQWLNTELADEGITTVLRNDVVNSSLVGGTTTLDLNQFSLYLYVTYGRFSALFTGDGDASMQEQIFQSGTQLPSNISLLKIPHHGSRTGLLPQTLKLLQPIFSVIQVGKNNYGHPNQDVIYELSAYGDVFRTDKQGNIEFIVDLQGVQVVTQK
ncbi:hypothetical protein C4579_02685 [Candidatus Microgenomates bacterium]|nr:MAG: hypothetical protein C4579_02685 [Candidatus Microgenomates bacterium]